MRRVNHSAEYVGEDGANVNQAESWFSRLRRAEYGIHHRISGSYLYQYANEMAWRGITAASRTGCISAGLQVRRSAIRNPRPGAAIGKGARHDR
jgi:hypothetical protein